MAIPTIHVGCGQFGLGRLQMAIKCKGLEPVACVDIDLETAHRAVQSLQGEGTAGLANRIYRSITEAREKNYAEACLIYTATPSHVGLVIESLNLGMHTLCVKPMACNQGEFQQIMKAHGARPGLMLVQGQNNRWNPAAAKMREWLRQENGIGEMLGGECRGWIRQKVNAGGPGNPPQADTYVEGLFFHSAACHQLDQLVAAKGLPKYVTAYVHRRSAPELDLTGVWGTAGGQALFEYENGAPFSYTGTRAAHADPFGLGSRWSGHWTFHGEKGDIRRDGGHLQMFRQGRVVDDWYLQDLHPGLGEDDRIQLDAFADALTTGKDREWLQESTLGTWILMEACNESARTQSKLDVNAFRRKITE